MTEETRIDPMTYPIILLDVDDTLLDFHAAEACAIRDTLGGRGIDPTGETVALYSRINRSWWEKFERGQVEKEELLWRRFEEFFARVAYDGDPRQAQQDYHENLGKYAFLIPGADVLCEALKDRGHRLYIVTNGTTIIQQRRFGASGLGRFVDGIFISEQMGTQKPARAFFERVFAALGQPDKGDCIIFGDSQTSDMAGGRDFGIATCWYDPKHSEKKGDWTYTVHDLMDFLEVVG